MSTAYYLNDRLGTAGAQTNASATVTATRSYDAFGMLVATTGTPQGPFGFAAAHGYQEDSDSGLKLLGHRYYDPSTGRFLTRDSIKDGRNWYVYCGNNPARHIDPTGEFWPVIILIAVAVLAAVALYRELVKHGEEGKKARDAYKKHFQAAVDPDGPTVGPGGGPPQWAQESPPEFQDFNRKTWQLIVNQINDQYVNATVSAGVDDISEGSGVYFDLLTGGLQFTTGELEKGSKGHR